MGEYYIVQGDYIGFTHDYDENYNSFWKSYGKTHDTSSNGEHSGPLTTSQKSKGLLSSGTYIFPSITKPEERKSDSEDKGVLHDIFSEPAKDE